MSNYIFKVNVHGKWQFYQMIDGEPYTWTYNKKKKKLEYQGTVICQTRLKNMVKIECSVELLKILNESCQQAIKESDE